MAYTLICASILGDRSCPPVPGPQIKTDGRNPADQSIRRLPLLVWGDVFLNGDVPQVRRALAGSDAHECMYTWVYLNELVTVRELAAVAAQRGYTFAASYQELYDRFAALLNNISDPQFQISGELLDMFIPLALFVDAVGAEKTEYCELGSTFFVSIEKLEICGRLLGLPLTRGKLLFSGIEYSPFLKRTAALMHPGDEIRLVTEAREWQPARDHAIHVSRFVGSYAFRATEEFVREIVRCDVFHLIDVFNLGEDDFHSWDLGLPISFLSLPTMVDGLVDAGFDVFLMKSGAEFHAAGEKRAMVVRLFGIRRNVAQRVGYYDKFTPLGGFEEACGARALRRGDGSNVVQEVDRSLSVEQWEDFAEYKRFFPIWGGPTGLSKDDVAKLVSSEGLSMNLRFDSGQSAAVVRKALQDRVWEPH